jgi:hypothetical protein
LADYTGMWELMNAVQLLVYCENRHAATVDGQAT